MRNTPGIALRDADSREATARDLRGWQLRTDIDRYSFIRSGSANA